MTTVKHCEGYALDILGTDREILFAIDGARILRSDEHPRDDYFGRAGRRWYPAAALPAGAYYIGRYPAPKGL
jgi:hypothetical protein